MTKKTNSLHFSKYIHPPINSPIIELPSHEITMKKFDIDLSRRPIVVLPLPPSFHAKFVHSESANEQGEPITRTLTKLRTSEKLVLSPCVCTDHRNLRDSAVQTVQLVCLRVHAINIHPRLFTRPYIPTGRIIVYRKHRV